jgi:hypothetical protein
MAEEEKCNGRERTYYDRFNSVDLAFATVALGFVGQFGVFFAALVVAAAVRPAGGTQALFWWLTVIGGLVMWLASSIFVGRWAARRGTELTPRRLGIDAVIVGLAGLSWSSFHSPEGTPAMTFLSRALVAVVGWRLGAWSVTERQPNMRLQRPAG